MSACCFVVQSLTMPTGSLAGIVDFAYSGPGISASGTLTINNTPLTSVFPCPTCNDATDGHLVTAISGQRNGVPISGLIPPHAFAGNNNVIFTGQPFLDWGGLGFTVNGTSYNVYFGAYGFTFPYYPGFPPSIIGYAECGTPDCSPLGGPPIDVALDSFSLSPIQTPEPAPIWLMLAALLITGLQRRLWPATREHARRIHFLSRSAND